MTNGAQSRVRVPRMPAAWAGGGVLLALAFALTLPLRAQTFTVLYMFAGKADGQYPQAGVILDGAGNLYGTTLAGGASDNCGTIGPGCGTVFKLDPAGARPCFTSSRDTRTTGQLPTTE